jgi:Mg2+ and Co2+ transporter CorA
VIYAVPVTRQEIEEKMDELAREYHDTHDPEIPEEIFELARRLGEMEHSIDTDSDLEQRMKKRPGSVRVRPMISIAATTGLQGPLQG